MLVSIDIDDDVLEAAIERAARLGTDVGRVLSELARQALAERHEALRNGVPVFPRRPAGDLAPTMDLVNRLRDA